MNSICPIQENYPYFQPMIPFNKLTSKAILIGLFLLVYNCCYSQSLISSQIETTYRDAVKKVQSGTRQWLNNTKASWIKNPELSSLRSQINKQFIAYNNRERETLVLVVIVEAIRENEKEHQDLKLQAQSVQNDETKLNVIKSRLNYQTDATSSNYYQAAEAIIIKYATPPPNPATDKHTASSTKKPTVTIHNKISSNAPDSTPTLVKNIDATLVDIHSRRQVAESAYQPVEQKMNRLGQALTTVFKSVTDLRNVPLRTSL
jgi:hypothetical protein